MKTIILFLMFIFLLGCDKQIQLSNFKRPIIVIANNKGDSKYVDIVLLRDANGDILRLTHSDARPFNNCYKVGDTIR